MKQSELKEFLKTLQNNLNILREREAKFGFNVPIELINQIDDHETAVQLVQLAMQGDISTDELEEQLLPLNLRLHGDTEIVAGKNIVKIGNITVPALPLIIAVLLVLNIVAVLAWYYLVPDKMPLNTFNVAVADFGQVDAEGKVSDSEDGQNLSEWMFGELQAEYKNWPTNQPEVWHDSMGFLQKRSNIGTVQGDTPEARQQSAQQIAERIGASMIVYGNIAIDENPPHFIPEFYIVGIENEADEIVGTHQLGSPIEVRLPLDLYDQRAASFFEQNLGVRADALVWFTRGLALDLSGRHEDALAVFEDADAEEQLKSWDESQGREILYYFMGRENLFLSRDNDETLDNAELAFKQALDINPNYARAHLGLGGVYFQRVQQLPPEERLQQPYLDLTLNAYTQAIEQGANSPGSQIETKGLLALGKTYRLLGEAHLHGGDLDQAIPAYDEAIDNIEKAISLLDVDQHRLLAEANLGLGIAYHGRAHIESTGDDQAAAKALFEKAQTAYQTCIEEADAEFYDTTVQDVKNKYCTPYSQEVQKVLESF